MDERNIKRSFAFSAGLWIFADGSLEDASRRELREECTNTEVALISYIGSLKVDDERYREDKDRVITAFFCFKYIFGTMSPGDDIFEIKKFSIDKITKEDIVEAHWPLLEMFLPFYAARRKEFEQNYELNF